MGVRRPNPTTYHLTQHLRLSALQGGCDGYFATGSRTKHHGDEGCNAASFELDTLPIYSAAPDLLRYVLGLSVLLRHLHQPVQLRFLAARVSAVRRAGKLHEHSVQPQ